jgi:hypothetical protein
LDRRDFPGVDRVKIHEYIGERRVEGLRYEFERAMTKVKAMRVPSLGGYLAYAVKNHPVAHAFLALATLIAIWTEPCAVPAATPDTELNFARQFDIGSGRELFLECRGVAPSGHPTVVLISCYHDSSDPWTERDVLSLLPHAIGPAVLPG